MADIRKKIYLIDDDDTQLTTAELFLKSEYEIFKATSGQEALDYINNNRFMPDIIMLDIIMPNMDGWETLKKLKKIDFLKFVPIVFLTSVGEEIKQKEALKMGVADYIVKPYNMTELKSRVKDVIKKSEMRKPR